MKRKNPYDQKVKDYLTSKTFRIKLIVTITALSCSCSLLIITIMPILKEIGIIQIR